MTMLAAVRGTLSRRERLGALPRLVVDLVRYGAASAAALLVDAGTLALLNRVFGVDYLVASASGFLLGLVVVYLLSVRYVYEDARALRPAQEAMGFLVTGFVGLGLTQALMALLVGWLALPVMIAKIPTVGVVFLFNFLSRRMLLFSVRDRQA
jgi:putative flippase GtrA